MARRWFKLKSKSVTGDYEKHIWRSLERGIFPIIGEIPVQALKARTIVEALEPIKARGALETVRRLIKRIYEIMIYAVNTRLIDANPASGIGVAFEKTKKTKYANTATRRTAQTVALFGYLKLVESNSLSE